MHAAVAALTLTLSAYSAEPAFSAQACQFTMATALPDLDAQKIAYTVLDEADRIVFLAAIEAATGQSLSMVTNVLIADIEGQMFFGLEIDGCLLPPQPVAAFLPDEQLSGTLNGKTGA